MTDQDVPAGDPSVSMFDFGDGRGPVPARRHRNPDGSVGGWVANSARVSGNAYVYGDAQVSGDSQVSGNARVYGDARVYGNAYVSGNAQVSGDSQVSGDARVYGNAGVSGNARVSGNAQVYGDAYIDRGTLDKNQDISTGMVGGYTYCIVRDSSGTFPTTMRFGCEYRTIEEWQEELEGLCRRHEPKRWEFFMYAIEGLLKVGQAMELAGKPVPQTGVEN